MKKAFKTYSQIPQTQQPAGIPQDWVWSSVDILDDRQAAFESAGFTVLSIDDFNQYKYDRQEAFDTWANAYDIDKHGQELLVVEYVDDKFVNYTPSKIDFRMHLKTDVYLQKNVSMLPNGRPHIATYSLDGENIAEIEFVFEVNAYNFMTRRTEKLSYYKRNGDKSEQWIIADDLYNINNTYHLQEMMKERSGARVLILEEIKAFLNGVLAAFYIPQGKTYLEILEIAGDFWEVYSIDINAWINVGSPKFKNNLTTDSAFAFLDANVSESLTVREYIINKLSY